MAKSKVTEWDDVYTNADGLGELFGMARETITRLAKLEGLPKASRGEYHVKECVNWLNERTAAKNDTPEDKKARILVAKQQELRYKIENSKNLNELLPADIVQAAINQMASTLANQLDGLAPRMAAELAQIDDPAVIQRKLFDECRAIRNTAAASFEAIASDTDSSGDTETTTKPKRRAVGRRRKSATTKQSGAGQVANG